MSDGYREIQLTGKQLVFLFMSVVVVAVVIFLLGVSVGRSVPPTEVAVAAGAGIDTPAIETDPVSGGPQPGGLTYNEVLQNGPPVPAAAPPDAGPGEVVAEPEPEAPEASEAPEPPVPDIPAPSPVAPPAPQPPPAPAPAADGEWFVQVGAFGSLDNAEALVSRLRSDGYEAFLTTIGSLHRVRVGPYADRAEADRVADRLREEGNSPSVTR